MPRVGLPYLLIGLSLSGAAVASCSGDCKGVEMADTVLIELPASVDVSESSVQICIDERCSADGKLPSMGLIVEGQIVGASFGSDLAVSGSYRVRVTVTGRSPLEASVDAKPSVEDHGCSGSNLTIRLRYDEQSRELRRM